MEQDKTITIEHPSLEVLKAHEGEWVALVGDQVVAAGDDVIQVQARAHDEGHQNVILYLVPSSASSFAPLIF